jgi:4-amino-4-deoxy-L-arabinose transferase-like glycosyltransferase
MNRRAPVAFSRTATDIAVLAGFCGFLFFFGLSYFGLIGADEPRYSQVAREMLVRHDWITPTLGGKPWLEKPVLYYWQAIIAYRLFGVSDWAARLPSAFDATLMVVAVYVFFRRFRPGFQLDGALIAASSAAVIGFGRAASTDMPLTAMFTIALLAWYAWYEGQVKACLAISYFFLGLGVLAKGPVALLLTSSIIVLFAAMKREWRKINQTLWIPGIAIFLATVLPWYVAVQEKNPDFFRQFIWQQNFARFGTNLYHHPEPFWYFIPVALIALLPWTVFAVLAIFKTATSWWRTSAGRADDRTLSLYLLIWLIVPVLFFSISRSKLPGYIVPAAPAGTLLVAEYIRTQVLEKKLPHLWQIGIHAIVVSSLMVPALMIQYILLEHRIPWNKVATPLIVALVCAIAITLFLRISGLRMLRFATLIPVLLIVGLVLRTGSSTIDALLSARPIANEILRLEPALGSKQVAVFGAPRETEYGLTFYLNRQISRYELHEIPETAHVVIAPAGSQSVVAASVPGRRVSYLGSFTLQKLDYFWVSGR